MKSIGTIVPGFVPEPYVPSGVEIAVCAGLWALGTFVFTVLAKAAISIELAHMASRPATDGDAPRPHA